MPTHYHAELTQLLKILGSVDRWLDKAVSFAKAKSFDPNVLLQARLSPDMFSLARQIQSACDGVKFYAARLAGKQAPKHPDTEQTIDELKARIKSVVEYFHLTMAYAILRHNGVELGKYDFLSSLTLKDA